MSARQTSKAWVATAIAKDAREHQQDGSPVEQLLKAVAACFALSCRAAAAGEGLSVGSVKVKAIAEKAASPPSRLGRLALEVSIDTNLAAAEIERIVTKAQALCTVTNSLSADLPIEIESTSWD